MIQAAQQPIAMTMLQAGITWTGRAIDRARRVFQRVEEMPLPNNNQAARGPRLPPDQPFFGHVTGVEIDPNTGSKVVSIRRILSFMPYDYDHSEGAAFYAWAGFDSLVSVGHYVKCTPMAAMMDEPASSIFVELVTAARQDTLPFPDAQCIAAMLAPCVPPNPSTSCLLAPLE